MRINAVVVPVDFRTRLGGIKHLPRRFANPLIYLPYEHTIVVPMKFRSEQPALRSNELFEPPALSDVGSSDESFNERNQRLPDSINLMLNLEVPGKAGHK